MDEGMDWKKEAILLQQELDAAEDVWAPRVFKALVTGMFCGAVGLWILQMIFGE